MDGYSSAVLSILLVANQSSPWFAYLSSTWAVLGDWLSSCYPYVRGPFTGELSPPLYEKEEEASAEAFSPGPGPGPGLVPNKIDNNGCLGPFVPLTYDAIRTISDCTVYHTSIYAIYYLTNKRLIVFMVWLLACSPSILFALTISSPFRGHHSPPFIHFSSPLYADRLNPLIIFFFFWAGLCSSSFLFSS